MIRNSLCRVLTASGLLLALCCVPAMAQQSARAAGEAAGEPQRSERALTEEQEAIRVRFDRFEDTLAKMARYLQKTEPARAELVLRALGRSQEEQVADRMERIIELLSREEGKSARYADAVEEQEAILADLRELLTILRSEDILDENRKEQERLKELARQVAALIDAEKVHQAATQRGEPTDRVAQGQKRTADRTGEVIREVDEHDRAAERGGEAEQDGKPGEGKPGEGKPGEGKPGEEKKREETPGEGKQGEGKQGEGQESEEKEGDEKQGEGDQNDAEEGDQEGKQQSGEQGEQSGQEGQQSGQQGEQSGQKGQQGQQGQQGQKGQNGEQESGEQEQGEQQSEQEGSAGPQRATPGREELEAAREKMERAIEELEKQQRENASKAQEEAIRKLIEAKEKIEELLRQLREEERELMLRALEARFQKMLQLQQVVLATTEELKGIAKDAWQDREFARCRDSAATEREIGLEADKALEVLRADGSSVAFPEAVEQVRSDVAEVAGRLGREDAGELTVAIEREIIDALQEMILALQKEMEKIREQKKGQPQQGQPGDPSLVDQLAELKMLKTLQLRVNRRTKTLGRLFTGEQASEPDVVKQLQELAERQGRLQQATYDLAAGKTTN